MAWQGVPAIGEHNFLNAFINESASITENAAEDLELPAHRAVAYDPDGNVLYANDGETAIGVIMSPSINPIVKGKRVEIFIKYIVLLETTEELFKGDLVTITTGGYGKKAVSGDFIFGRAFTHSMPGECVQVQINQSGYLA